MSDHRCILKIEFSIYGKKFEWDTSINWDNHTGDGGIDSRIANWFADCYAEARAAWDATNAASDELLRRTGVESRERLELARLKAKYETDNQVISLRRTREVNPILPQPPDHTTFRASDAGASTDDFDRTLGPNWTDTYDGAGAWGRMGMASESSVRWRNPTPAGEFTTSGITCRICGCKVAMTAGDVIKSGDPRLCEHLGGPTSKHPRGFGMKAEGLSLGDITGFTIDEPKCTCAPGTSRTSCPVHGLHTVYEPEDGPDEFGETHGYWEKGDY